MALVGDEQAGYNGLEGSWCTLASAASVRL